MPTVANGRTPVVARFQASKSYESAKLSPSGIALSLAERAKSTNRDEEIKIQLEVKSRNSNPTPSSSCFVRKERPWRALPGSGKRTFLCECFSHTRKIHCTIPRRHVLSTLPKRAYQSNHWIWLETPTKLCVPSNVHLLEAEVASL